LEPGEQIEDPLLEAIFTKSTVVYAASDTQATPSYETISLAAKWSIDWSRTLESFGETLSQGMHPPSAQLADVMTIYKIPSALGKLN
jgi:hypothetical protein